MNGGTRRGQADGFKVEALDRLYTTKILNVTTAEEQLEDDGEKGQSAQEKPKAIL